MRQRDRLDGAAGSFERGDALLDGGAHLGVEAFGKVLCRDADAQARLSRFFDGLVAFGGIVFDGSRGAGGVLGIVAGDDAEQRGGVAHVGGEGADAIERRSEGDEAVARDAAVGGQHADHAAKAGGLADGAAGVGAERGHGEIRSHGRGRAAARAAGNALRVDGIAHRPVSRILIRRAHGELVAVELAQQHCARGFEPRDGGAVVGRPVALKDFGACGRRRALNNHHVFDAHGNAGQRRAADRLWRRDASMRAACARARSLVKLR